jgi:hypothetical protein
MTQDVLGMFAAGGFAEVVAHRRRTDNRNNQRPSALCFTLRVALSKAATWCVACCKLPTGSGLGALGRAWVWLVCGHASA